MAPQDLNCLTLVLQSGGHLAVPWIWASVGIGVNLLKELLLGSFGSCAVTTFCLGLILSIRSEIDLGGDCSPTVWCGQMESLLTPSFPHRGLTSPSEEMNITPAALLLPSEGTEPLETALGSSDEVIPYLYWLLVSAA